MVSKRYLIYFTVLITVASQIHGACVCNEKGADYCAGCTGRRIVRPKPKYPDGNPDIKLPPIGDNCWCSKLMIEPAALPKPCSKLKKPPPPPPPSCGCKSSPHSSSSAYDSLPSIFSPSYSPSSYVVPQANYVPTVPKDGALPADPISVSLAIQAGKAIEVPEAKLAYGFVQKPIDGLPKVYVSSVKEENLYAMKKDVITLKKQMPTKKVEDYPEVEDEELSGANVEEEDLPRLTYKQLGYVAEQYKNPQFQEVPSAYSSYSTGYVKPPSVVPGNCGYKPGRIAKYM